jgi:methionyl-tRNA formyltransferase
MRIVFIGSVLFSKYMLETILASRKECQVVGVITKEKSSFNSDHFNLAPLAVENNIPYKYVKDINHPNIIKWISELEPDVLFCMGWSALIKQEVLNISRMGVVGFHPSALPQNRGRHPLIWAIVLGLNQTATTFFKMDESADTGDIVNQKIVNITSQDNAGSLYQKMIMAASEQIIEVIDGLMNNQIVFISQLSALGNTWRKRSRKDGLIDFRMSSVSIYNLVRALAKPYPNAEIEFEGVFIRVNHAEIGHNRESNIEPGKILSINNQSIEVKTADGSIWLIDHEFKVLPKVGQYIL